MKANKGVLPSTIQKLFSQITTVEDKTSFPNGDGFYLDEQDGKKGFNTDPQRGADTFTPFSSESLLLCTTNRTIELGSHKYIYISWDNGLNNFLECVDLEHNRYRRFADRTLSYDWRNLPSSLFTISNSTLTFNTSGAKGNFVYILA